MRTKYVKFRNLRLGDDAGEDFVLIFPEVVVHSDIAQNMNREYIPISAGFVDGSPGKYRAFGRSESLNLDSEPTRDSVLINRALGGTYYD